MVFTMMYSLARSQRVPLGIVGKLVLKWCIRRLFKEQSGEPFEFSDLETILANVRAT